MARLPLLLVALLVAAAQPAIPHPTVAVSPDSHWSPGPQCETVQSEGNFTFSKDGGFTLTPTAGSPAPRTTGSVAVLEHRDSLVGMVDSGFFASTDSGCTWRRVAEIEGLTQYELVAGPRDTAFAFAANYPEIHRVTPRTGVTTVLGPVPGDGIRGIWIHPYRDTVLRSVTKAGEVHSTTDGGRTWSRTGAAPAGTSVYDAAFGEDGQDIVLGTSGDGVLTSDDGGLTWSRAAGMSRTNAFEVQVSEVDPTVVWAEAFHLDESGNAARKVSLSVDGGRTFTPQVDGTEIRLTNGPLMVPDPVEPGVLWVQFGTYFAGYGTDLYRYDADTGTVTTRHHQVQGISSLDFHPRDPGVLYLGITRVQ